MGQHCAPGSGVVVARHRTDGHKQRVSELKKQQERLTLENSVAQQQLQKDLAKLTAKNNGSNSKTASPNNNCTRTWPNSPPRSSGWNCKTAWRNKSSRLTPPRFRPSWTSSRSRPTCIKRATLKEAERKAQLDEELAAGREQLEKMKLTNDLATAEIADKAREMARREQELKLQAADLQAQKADLDLKVARLNSDLDLRTKHDLWKNRVNHDIQYTKDPFKDGVLTISDRRIALNGPIWGDTADYVQERIDYFNNQSHEYPIFIVIDESPGGSVMAGYKILKAMDGSAAPVYVVVKSFAASMAANIVTQAKKSFAYPNAIILHHQISGYACGNLTMKKEDVKEMEEWWKRLAAPVATKMGISLDEFIKRMYQNRSTGNWVEFGDSARKLKWVDRFWIRSGRIRITKIPTLPPR